MRYTDDPDMSFCLTMSDGIDRAALLRTLGMVEELPEPQAFDDVDRKVYLHNKKNALNVFEEDGILITLENDGYLGVARRTINKIAAIPGERHFMAVCFMSFNGRPGCQFVEVQDGLIVANFDPDFDDVPVVIEDFFPKGGNAREGMIKALEFRMATSVKPEWLESKTATYVIDYRVDREV